MKIYLQVIEETGSQLPTVEEEENGLLIAHYFRRKELGACGGAVAVGDFEFRVSNKWQTCIPSFRSFYETGT